MQVHNAVVHHLVKEKDSNAVLTAARSVLSAGDAVDALISGVHNFFNQGRSVVYGSFETSGIVPTKNILKSYRDGKGEFIEATRDICDVLLAEINKADWATGGYLLFCDFTYDNNEFFIVCMLDKIDGVSIDDETLAVSLMKHLEFKRLRQAVLLSVDMWEREEVDYLSFVRQSSQDFAAKYFFNAMGCSEYDDANRSTTSVAKALDKYLRETGASTQQIMDTRRSFVHHLAIAFDENRSITLSELSRVVESRYPIKDNNFEKYIRGKKLRIPDNFKVGPSYKKIRDYRANAGNYRIYFNEDALNDREIEFVPKDGILIVRNLPDKLQAKLRERLNESQ